MLVRPGGYLKPHCEGVGKEPPQAVLRKSRDVSIQKEEVFYCVSHCGGVKKEKDWERTVAFINKDITCDFQGGSFSWEALSEARKGTKKWVGGKWKKGLQAAFSRLWVGEETWLEGMAVSGEEFLRVKEIWTCISGRERSQWIKRDWKLGREKIVEGTVCQGRQEGMSSKDLIKGWVFEGVRVTSSIKTGAKERVGKNSEVTWSVHSGRAGALDRSVKCKARFSAEEGREKGVMTRG